MSALLHVLWETRRWKQAEPRRLTLALRLPREPRAQAMPTKSTHLPVFRLWGRHWVLVEHIR